MGKDLGGGDKKKKWRRRRGNRRKRNRRRKKRRRKEEEEEKEKEKEKHDEEEEEEEAAAILPQGTARLDFLVSASPMTFFPFADHSPGLASLLLTNSQPDSSGEAAHRLFLGPLAGCCSPLRQRENALGERA